MSLSKPVFAYSVMLLRRRGAIDLDTPLTRYLPEPYIENEPRLELITARTVLSHQTGFPNWRPQGEPLRLLRAPGTRFGYSGEGFVYLQRVVEGICGVPLDRYIREQVFQPLGMDDSSFVWRGDYAGPAAAAAPHDAHGAPIAARDFSKANAASSLHTTARDYARFVIALIGAGDAPLDATQLAEMFAPQVRIDAGLSWSLGCGIEHTGGGDAVWHWGADDGAATFFVLNRATGAGAVVLTNGGNGRAVYKPVVQQLLGGEHPALEVESNAEWVRLMEG